LNVTGAEVSHQAAIVTLQWGDGSQDDPALTLWFEDAEAAAYWAEALGFAAGVGDGEEAEAPKVQELENRVAAALRAAYDRAARIKELEDTIEAGKDREQRIQQLEEVLHDTLEEAEARAEKIEALEWQLERGPKGDAESRALLQDAMEFADQLLEQHSGLFEEDDDAAALREAVQAVQQSKPDIDADVAELIRQLVTALRWPVVLRERLADAEATVKEQEEIQEQALREIIDLQKKCDTLEAESEEQKVALEAAKQQTALTDVAHQEEMQKLKDREEEAERKRHDAEEKAKELRELLDYADQAAEEAIQRKEEELEQSHATEIEKLRQLTEVANLQQRDAHTKAVELHEQLARAEAAIDAKAEQEKEKLSAQHQEEISSLKKEILVVEQQRDSAKQEAVEFNKQLEDSQKGELLKLREELERAKSKETEEVLHEKQKQTDQFVEELEELKKSREATDRRRAEAEGHLTELREMLTTAQKKGQDAVASTKSMETKHAQELRGLQSRCESAEVQEQLAEAKAQRMKEKLMSELQAADEAASKSHKSVDKERDRELEDVRKQQHEAELNRKAADARADELRKRLEEAEKRALEATQQQKVSLDAEREEEVNKLREQMQTAEEKVDKMESQASQFREKLAAAEVSLSEEAQRRRDLLEHERLRSKANFDDKDRELEQRLENAEKTLKSLEESDSKPSDQPQKSRRKKGQRA